MIESLENAKEELKRIDHLIYVTLKYTRTVDVLRSVIERMVNSYEFIVNALVKKSLEENEDEEVPNNPIAKANHVLSNYTSKTITENVKRYLLFRKLKRVKYDKKNEFRRHVTMMAVVDDEKIDINIDNITEDFHALKKTLEKVEKIIND